MQVGPAVPPYPARFGDVRDVLRLLPYPPNDGTRYALDTDIFTVRHQLIRELRPAPRSVFEFGALYGFFLVTALDAAAAIELVGAIDDESHTPGSNTMCLTNVLSVRPSVQFFGGTSRHDLERWPGLRADVVSVDGDHTMGGCLADLRAAERLQPRVIMVDDWSAPTHRDEIQPAVHRWLREQEPTWELVVHETVNGLAVLEQR